MGEKYYIEYLNTSPTDEDSDSGKAIISCKSHGACIEVYGKDEVLTQRVIKILNGLNAEEEKH